MFGPLVARPLASCGDRGAHVSQGRDRIAARRARIERQQPRELGEKLRLEAGDGDIAAVGGLVGVVEGRAAVEQIVAAPFMPQAGRDQGIGGAASIEAPSVIAASTTWPLPERCRSNIAASTPAIRNIAPPP